MLNSTLWAVYNESIIAHCPQQFWSSFCQLWKDGRLHQSWTVRIETRLWAKFGRYCTLATVSPGVLDMVERRHCLGTAPYRSPANSKDDFCRVTMLKMGYTAEQNEANVIPLLVSKGEQFWRCVSIKTSLKRKPLLKSCKRAGSPNMLWTSSGGTHSTTKSTADKHGVACLCAQDLIKLIFLRAARELCTATLFKFFLIHLMLISPQTMA